jgi:DNA mismatch repair ATPase MutS
MDQQVNLNKQVFEKRQYDKTINTQFTQLVQPSLQATGSALPTVNEFFDFYNQLFFDIPKLGETNSHEYLIKTSTEYIGASSVVNDELQALIDEVTELRQENLDLQQQLLGSITQTITNNSTTPSMGSGGGSNVGGGGGSGGGGY